MAPQAAVDRAAMQQAANRIEETAQVVQGMKSLLETNQGAIRSSWEGGASNAFNGIFSEFLLDFEKVKKALERMHGKLTDNRIHYDKVEQDEQDAVKELNSMLGTQV